MTRAIILARELRNNPLLAATSAGRSELARAVELEEKRLRLLANAGASSVGASGTTVSKIGLSDLGDRAIEAGIRAGFAAQDFQKDTAANTAATADNTRGILTGVLAGNQFL